MRHLIALGLCLCAVTSAVAQTEVIIRRPGEKDQVIQLDSSARAKEAMARAQVELRRATTTVARQVKELQQQLGRTRLTELPTRINTLALKNAELATRTALAPMMLRLKELNRQPRLGVVVTTVPRETDKWGAYVTSVTPGSPADKAGILSGDIITRIAGKSLTEKTAKGEDSEDSSPGLRLINIVSQLEPGKAVEVDLRRGTQNRTVKVTPVEDEMPSMARLAPGTPMPGGFAYSIGRDMGKLAMPEPSIKFDSPSMSIFSQGGPGTFYYSFDTNGLFGNLELVSLNEKLGSYFGTSEGVLVVSTEAHRLFDGVVTGMPGTVSIRRRTDTTGRARGRGAAAGRMEIRADTINGEATQLAAPAMRRTTVDIGLEPGDVIVSVDGRKVTTPSQLMRIVGTYDRGDEFKLQIMRQKRAETLNVKRP